MIEKKTEKVKTESKEQFDLENQFILRLPEEPAKVLSEALQTGNLKDRMTIKLDNDLRYGEVCFDNWLFYAKVLDLPTIIECLKTIDTKSFYKSSDVCQIMICKEEQDEEPEKESPNKAKKKDPNKVDKKYLWPHGITPPCKNVRKRRFRKTLKKKNVDAPEIEKEVKRLLRIDNDAVKVEFEIINEDMDSRRSMDQSIKEEDSEFMDDTMNETSNRHNESREQEKRDSIGSDVDEDDATRNATSIGGVGEHDIFGEEVSSSDDDDERNDSQRMQDDDTSRLSADDTRISSYSLSGQGGMQGGHGGNNTNTGDNLFSKSMFGSPKRNFGDEFGGSSSNLAAPSSYFDDQRRHKYHEDDYSNDAQSQEQVKAKLQELHRQLDDLKMQKMQKSQEYSSIENPTLRQRMQDTLENLSRQITMKSKELADFESLWGVKQ